MDITEYTDVINSTWAFKLKQLPVELITKFVGHFCACGYKKLEGVDFFETYALVIQWTTFFLLLILEVLLYFKSKQDYITADFLHEDLEEDENLFVDMPIGFIKKGNVLKINKTIYGLRQSSRPFWKFLTEKVK